MRLLRRQHQNPSRGVSGQSIDGRSLPVGRYQPLEVAPELVWGRLSQELIHLSWPAVMELSAVWRRLDLWQSEGSWPSGTGERPAPLYSADHCDPDP